MKIAITLTVAAIAVVPVGAKFIYDAQEAWPDVRAPPGMGNQCDRDSASGIGQSPINILETDVCRASDVGYQFFSGDCTLGDYKFSINDHGIKAEIKAGALCTKPTMIMPGKSRIYEARQFHIHMGCEHTFNGEGCDAEMHIVHQAESSASVPSRTPSLVDLLDIAVVGIMVKGGDNVNDGMDPLIDSWSSVSCTDDCDSDLAAQYGGLSFNPYNLMAPETNFYKYTGSLTTPPCWEVVEWTVAESPALVSWRQILAMSNLVNNYAGYRNSRGECVPGTTVASEAGLTGRETQPLMGRQVAKICEPWSIEDDGTVIDNSPKALEENSAEAPDDSVLTPETSAEPQSTASAGSQRYAGAVVSIVGTIATLVGFGMQ